MNRDKFLPFREPSGLIRRFGATTRLIDSAVQELFTIGVAVTRDHHGSDNATKDFHTRLLDRLYREHRLKSELDHRLYRLGNATYSIVAFDKELVNKAIIKLKEKV
jgi:hypothetical protein